MVPKYDYWLAVHPPLHLDERVGEVPVLHDDDVLLDPVVERGGELAELLQLLILILLCRPDLIDWKKVERMRVRERIDLAFHVMDREYGVTRLLDPEGGRRKGQRSLNNPGDLFLDGKREVAK